MVDLPDVLWKMYDNHITHGRHHETQRSTIAGLILAVATALLGVASIDKELTGPFDALVGAALVGLGLFGAGFALKQSERWDLHMERARRFRNALDDELGGKLKMLKEAADENHEAANPYLHKMRLRVWWIGLNFAVSVVGLVVILFALRVAATTAP
jgi:hypothetical protein